MIRGLLVLVAGCMPSVIPDKAGSPGLAADTADAEDTGASESRQTLALVSTLASDYSVGALATLDLSTLALSDTLAPIAGDAVVRALETQAAVLNRLNTDTLRLYTPGSWSAPSLELALPDLSNPQDAAECGGKLWVSLHSADHIPAYDAAGRRVASADLSAWSGSDGAAEAMRMQVYDGALYVALEQFAQDDGWASEGGAVVRIDCETAEVVEVAAAAPSPSIVSGPVDGVLGLRTGLYGELDGELALLDLDTGERETVLTEAEVGADIVGFAIHGSSLVYLTAGADWSYGVHCLDLENGERTTGPSGASFLSDVAIDDRGRAWVSARAGWSGEGPEQPGLWVLDSERCTSVLAGSGAIRTTLAPYNVSFL